jgi:hypothetical protein
MTLAGVDAQKGYYVCRQWYYYSGERMVELTEGGLDFSGPDQLVAQYPELGECRAFERPQEAALAAIKVMKAWQKDAPNEEIHVTVRSQLAGYSGMEGEPWTIRDIRLWAQEAWEAWEKLPKCVRCGEVVSEDDAYGNCRTVFNDNMYPFCSEYCAEEDYYELMEELEKE